MDTKIYSANVVNSQDLRDHIKYNLNWLESADPREEFPKVKIWLSKSSGFFNRGIPEFVTKILVKSKGNVVFAEAKGNKLATSINNANKKVKSMIFKSKKGGR